MYADSEVQGDELQELNHHLGQCASCRQVLAEQKSLDWLLKNKPIPQITDQYLDTFWDQLFEKIDNQQPYADPDLQGEQYPLLERLATTATGELFLTRTIEADDAPRPLILKRLSSRYAEDSEYILTFIRSAQLTSQLKHEHICPIIKAGTDSKGSYLVRGYIAGVNLEMLFQRHAHQRRLIPHPVTLKIISAISKALEHAHLQIVHGNLTPSDVLLGFKGEIGLINFGMGNYWAQQFQAGSELPLERARYLTPEHLSGGVIDQRTDVFSMALIMYELLTGKAVFPEGLNQHSLAQMTQHTVPTPSSVRPSLSNTLDTVVMKALEVDPADRYSSIQEIREEIEGIIADDTGSEMNLATLMMRIFSNESRVEADRLALVMSGTIPELSSQPLPPPVETNRFVPTLTSPMTAPQAVSPNIILQEETQPANRWWIGIAASLLVLLTGGVIAALMQSRESSPTEVAMVEPPRMVSEKRAASTESRAAVATTPSPAPKAEPSLPATAPTTNITEDSGDADAAERPLLERSKASIKPQKAGNRRRSHKRRPRRRPRLAQAGKRSRPSTAPKASPTGVVKPKPTPDVARDATFGYLKVDSATAVDVVVDGWKATTTNGKLNLKLSPGPHQVKVVFKSTGQSLQRMVVIKPGKTKILRLVLGQ